MALTEQHRRSIHESLEAVHGEEIANHLMELLPRHPESELVTRTDALATGTMLRGEMAEMRAELKTEMGELRTELTGDMSELRTELTGAMSDLRVDVRTEIAGLQKWAAGILAANGIAVVTALVA